MPTNAPAAQAGQGRADGASTARAGAGGAAPASAQAASQSQSQSLSQTAGQGGSGGGQDGASGSAANQQGASASASARTPATTAATYSQVSSPLQASTAVAGVEALTGAASGVPPAANVAVAQGSPGAAAAPFAGPVGMQEMINAIRATIEIAARQGATQARIALQPQELGQINIRLSQTSQGLLARVSAETPAAAQALADGRSELHQSLSSLGLPLLRLDISSYGQSQARERQERFTGEAGSASASSASTSPKDGDSSEPLSELEGAVAPRALAAGALVDVLA
jgi:flagellar hook-length control protein FliK